MNCLRYITDDMRMIEEMTLREYVMRMKAYYLRSLDRRNEALTYAFDKRMVEATTGRGKQTKYVYKSPDEILPVKFLSDQILEKTDKDSFSRLKVIASRMMKRRNNE